jgi:hypothetical protein
VAQYFSRSLSAFPYCLMTERAADRTCFDADVRVVLEELLFTLPEVVPDNFLLMRQVVAQCGIAAPRTLEACTDDPMGIGNACADRLAW